MRPKNYSYKHFFYSTSSDESDKADSVHSSKKLNLNLKEVNIVVTDCFMQENILNDSALMHNVPLIYRIKNSKQRSKIKREIKNEDFHSSVPKHSFEIKREQNNFETVTILTRNKENKCGLNTLHAKELCSKETDSQKKSLNLFNNYLLNKNGRVHSQESEAKETSSEKAVSVLRLRDLQNLTNNSVVCNTSSKFETNCTNNNFDIDSFIASMPDIDFVKSSTPLIEHEDQTKWDDNDFDFLDIIASFPEIEFTRSTKELKVQEDSIINSKEESSFHNINSLRKKRCSTDQIGGSVEKVPKLNETQSENINFINNSSPILGITLPQTQSVPVDEPVTLTYTINSDFTTRHSQLESNKNISGQEEREGNKNITGVTTENNDTQQRSNATRTEQTETDDEADDCISLDINADEFEFSLSDSMLETYYDKNKKEFTKIYDSENTDVVKNTSASKEAVAVANKIYDVPKQFHQIINIRTIFRSYCFTTIYKGQCYNLHKCIYKHHFLPLFSWWYKENEQKLYEIIEEMKHFTSFLRKHFYFPLLRTCTLDNVIYVLKILKKLFEVEVLSCYDVLEGIKSLQRVGYTVTDIINNLATIVDNRDYEFVNWIAKILKGHINNNEYWSTLRSLLLKIENWEIKVLETILAECRVVQTNIDDINKNVIQKLRNDIRSRINKDLLMCFKTLVKSNNNVERNVRVINVETIRSPKSSPSKEDECPNKADTVCKTGSQSSLATVDRNIPYKLQPIDNLPKPWSPWSRKKFWKCYVNLYSLQKGLEHNDQNHVMAILNSVQKDEKSIFTEAWYHILCNEIKYSPYRLSQTATSAVQRGATAIFYEILTDVTLLILADLAKKKLWILAYRLIKDLRFILNSQIQSNKLNAANVLLLARICLENKKLIEAFTLVKRTNIIYTNRYRWKVQSVEEDSAFRVKIIMLLLSMFYETFPRYGLALLDLISNDQCSNLFPIDLNSLLNKLVSSVVSAKDTDLLIDVVKLIKRHGYTMNSITFSTLLPALFHADINLAKQMYKLGVSLGIYSTLQFHPTTFFIVNVNWSREETHLALLDLFECLASNIGHAIDHVGRKRFNILLIYEDIPTNERLYQNRISNVRDDKIKERKKFMRELFREEFHPSILPIRTREGRIDRMIARNVLEYVKNNFL